jgi:hypothetical protein
LALRHSAEGRRWECLGFVVGLPVLQAVVELAEELVEQVPGRGGVTVTVFSSASIVLAGGLVVGGGGKGPHPADVGEPVVLMWRWVMEIDRPDARVMGAQPA